MKVCQPGFWEFLIIQVMQARDPNINCVSFQYCHKMGYNKGEVHCFLGKLRKAFKCSSTRFGLLGTNSPIDIDPANLLQHPLWMPTSTPSTVTILLVANAANVSLIGRGPPNAMGAWIISTMLLIPAGINLPVGYGVPLKKSFSVECFSLALLTNTAIPLPAMLKHGYRAPGVTDGARGPTQPQSLHYSSPLLDTTKGSHQYSPQPQEATLWHLKLISSLPLVAGNFPPTQ